MNMGWGRKSYLHVKDGGSNLHVMITVLKFIVNCECLGLKKKLLRFLFCPC
jgi:hypothetical protein